MNGDVAAGLGLLLLAGLYLAQTFDLQQSSLSDEVGPGGLPLMLAVLLAFLAAVLAARGWLAARAARTGRTTAAVEASPASDAGAAPIGRALGFLAVAGLYGPAAYALGYVGGLAVLIAAVAFYEGARPSWQLAAVACGGAAFFWLFFVQLLGVAQPRGAFF